MNNTPAPAAVSLDTLNHRSRLAMLDVRAQYAIIRELEARINSEPSMLPVLRSAQARLTTLSARYESACAAAVKALNEKMFAKSLEN